MVPVQFEGFKIFVLEIQEVVSGAALFSEVTLVFQILSQSSGSDFLRSLYTTRVREVGL